MSVPNIVTSRLLLRSWKESDFEPHVMWEADHRVNEFLPFLHVPRTAEASREQITRFLAAPTEKRAEWAKDWVCSEAEKPHPSWAVEVTGIPDVIGAIGFALDTFESDFTPCMEIGWRFAPEYCRAVRGKFRESFQSTAMTGLAGIFWQSRLASAKVNQLNHLSTFPGQPCARGGGKQEASRPQLALKAPLPPAHGDAPHRRGHLVSRIRRMEVKCLRRRRTEGIGHQGRKRPWGSMCLRPHQFHATRTVAWAAKRTRMRKDGSPWKPSLSASIFRKISWTFLFFLPKPLFLFRVTVLAWTVWQRDFAPCSRSSL